MITTPAHLPPADRPPRRATARGFSLVEVLLAIFILGIGMIMVASVFPVGADWTRQTTEDTVAQAIAQNAFTVIETHYGPGGDRPELGINVGNTVLSGATPFQLQPLPGLTNIPIGERAYQFGSNNPFPASNPAGCTYFWTALCRLNPAHNNGAGAISPAAAFKYDVYILVFRKGAAEHVFTPVVGKDIAGVRNYPAEDFVPAVWSVAYNAGQHDPARTPMVYNAVPPVGEIGVGVVSGTVFRQGIDAPTAVDFTAAGAGGAVAKPAVKTGGENVIYSPAADGTTASPLIYVYQTTLSQ
jgi:prepilin-type N-terminal cleavage/methylation domain-containing protein